MNAQYLSEQLHVVQALAPKDDLYEGSPQTDFISLKSYKSLMFVLEHGVGTTGTVVITVQNATDAAGTSPTDIPFRYRRVAATGTSDVPGALTEASATGFTTTAGSNQVYLIEVLAEELDEAKPFVAMTLTEGTDAVVAASVLAILGAPRFPGSTMLTAIA